MLHLNENDAIDSAHPVDHIEPVRDEYRAELQEALYFSTNRNRDERNAVAMLKAYYDGIVDSGLIPDDNHQVLSHGRPTFQHDGDNPRVEITITRK